MCVCVVTVIVIIYVPIIVVPACVCMCRGGGDESRRVDVDACVYVCVNVCDKNQMITASCSYCCLPIILVCMCVEKKVDVVLLAHSIIRSYIYESAASVGNL